VGNPGPDSAAEGERALYAPVKRFLERQGYDVKGEVEGCDVVAVRGDEPPLIVELKQRLNAELLLQGVERQRMSDLVYIALPAARSAHNLLRKKQRGVQRLLRRLGLGLLIVHGLASPGKSRGKGRKGGKAWVEAVLDPGPYRPRTDTRGRKALLREFGARVGDPNAGGSNKRPLVTAYRQQALRLAHELREGPLGLPALRERSGVDLAGRFAQRNVYGWFERTERGVYGITQTGRAALETYSDVIEELSDS
jgi:hypothetical protein